MLHMHRTILLSLLVLGTACVGEYDLGVAAFEVRSDGAILWTHIVPAREHATAIKLRAEVATDADFKRIVRRKPLFALKSNDFTARIRVHGLHSGTQYYYRFVAIGKTAFDRLASPTGSFRTAPADNEAAPLRFVISGDSNLGFTGPRGLDFYVLSAAAAENADFFVYFGDTIYADSGVLPGGDAVTLDEYREVHRLTRQDPHLQQLLASTGTFTGWDDHEVRNDYAGETVDPDQFEAGARAFFEYLPVREHPGHAPFRIDRTVRWGRHVELFFLDGRQFRSAEQFCNPTLPDGPETAETLFSPFVEDEVIAALILPAPIFEAAAPLLLPSDPDCVDTLLADPTRTLLGAAQLEMLKQDLLASTATFKIIVNNTPIASLLFSPYDRWEGYLAERQDLLDFLGANFAPGEVLVLTTDFHTNLAIQRDDVTELIIGPIGQSTFGLTVAALLPPELQPIADLVLTLIEAIIETANGPNSVLGSEPDAFSYAVVEVFEDDLGEPRLRVTARGDPDYLLGANDPALVQDLFAFELP
jgi:phosphodiesterase/alkaline phosphatase D-like protein